MKEAVLWEKEKEQAVRCNLCHQNCFIREGKTGFCGVRINHGGQLYTLVYGRLIAENVDPIEKKPFFHFYPGSLSFSIATVGCNFACVFCQNADISQAPKEERYLALPAEVPPEKVIQQAERTGCLSISYTYTEPTVFFEYALDVARLARSAGLKNNFVTNGYFSTRALKMIAPFLDAANVDLKGDDAFYRRLCQARQKPVVENISVMKSLGIWVEVTTLIIPGENDRENIIKSLAETIASISPDIPWHLSRFFPRYKMEDRTPTSCPVIRKARQIGLECGLKYVYTGNMPGDEGENTYCSKCHQLLIRRQGYATGIVGLTGNRCASCGTLLPGLF